MTDVVEWIPTIPEELNSFKNRAVVGGEEDGSPLWVVRSHFHGDMVPGKLIVKKQEASVAWGGKEYPVHEIQVACADAKRITWVQATGGVVPSNAIVSGYVRGTGENLYVGRGRYMSQLINGKIEPSQKTLYITYNGAVVKLKDYEVLCTAPMN